jgi:hypothetical protein
VDEQRSVDERFIRAMHSLVRALEMREVPLLLFDNQDPFPFLEQAAEMLRGSVIYASSADAKDQLLELLGSPGYIFLVVDAELSDPTYDVISYYLHMRDILPDWEPELERRYQDFPINPDNRLALIAELGIMQGQSSDRRRHVQKLSTVIVVR